MTVFGSGFDSRIQVSPPDNSPIDTEVPGLTNRGGFVTGSGNVLRDWRRGKRPSAPGIVQIFSPFQCDTGIQCLEKGGTFFLPVHA